MGEQVGLVNDQDGGSAAFGGFGGQRAAGLGDETCGVEGGVAAQGGDDVVVDASGAHRWVRDVEEVVAGPVDSVERGAGGHGFADADLAGDDGDAAGVDAVGDAGGGLGVVVVAVQHAGGEVAAERHPGKSVERFDSV